MKLSGFKFLTDENIPPELIQFFRDSNFDVCFIEP